MIKPGSLISFLLYSSLWVSVCAASLTVFTCDIMGAGSGIRVYTLFIFFGTLGLYALHRVLGLKQVLKVGAQGRFVFIEKYSSYIRVCAIAGIIGATVCLSLLSFDLLVLVAIPCVISLLYTVPLIAGKRLRDLDWIKIFLVAIVWSYLTGVIPFIICGGDDLLGGGVLFIERAAFAFAITLPFDVRDMRVDATSGVRTIAHLLGERRARIVSLSVLLISAICTTALIGMHIYDGGLILPALAAYVTTFFLILFTRPTLADWYYSGLLDGTTMLMPLLYWIWELLR